MRRRGRGSVLGFALLSSLLSACGGPGREPADLAIASDLLRAPDGPSQARSAGPEIILDEPAFTAAPRRQELSSLAWDGTKWLAVWESYAPSGLASSVRGVFIDASGKIGSPLGFEIEPGQGFSHSPVVAWDGIQFLVAWESNNGSTDGSDIRGRRVTADGTPL